MMLMRRVCLVLTGRSLLGHRAFATARSIAHGSDFDPRGLETQSETDTESEDTAAELEAGTSEDEDAISAATLPQVLTAYLRTRRARCLSRVREQGRIPAVLVDGDKSRRPKDGSTDVFLSLDAKPIITLVKFLGKRDFVSRVFNMDIYRHSESSEIHESVQVLPRNLNYGPGKTNILNIQFIRANPGQKLKLGVPLEFLGIDKCPGLMKGGTLVKLSKFVVYNCRATEVPAKIVVDMSVLEVGDRVLVQDLDVDFDRLQSERTMPVCEIVKDAATLKAKARKLKTEILYKKKALKEKATKTTAHPKSLSDDEIEVSPDDEMTSWRRPRTSKANRLESETDKDLKKRDRRILRPGTDKKSAKGDATSPQRGKPSKRRLFGSKT